MTFELKRISFKRKKKEAIVKLAGYASFSSLLFERSKITNRKQTIIKFRVTATWLSMCVWEGSVVCIKHISIVVFSVSQILHGLFKVVFCRVLVESWGGPCVLLQRLYCFRLMQCETASFS